MGIEILTEPTPPVDVIDIQAAAVPTPEEAATIYTYQREDGTVERARSAADAIARCHVLRELAKEDPEQVNVLLELAATGEDSAPTEARSQQKPEDQQKPTETVKSDNKTEPKIERLTETSSDVPVMPESAVIAAGPTHRRDKLQPADQTSAEQALLVTEIHRLMKDPIDELQQPTETERKATSQRKEPAVETKDKVAPSLKSANDAIKPSASHDHTDPKEPIEFKAAPSDTAQYPLPEDILPAKVEISSVINDQTPVLAFQPDLDMLFGFREFEPAIGEVESYVYDGRPLEAVGEEELLVAEEALPRVTDLAEAGASFQHEAVFDYEVMDTFEQLIELAYVELAEIHTPELEQPAETAELIDGQAILLDPETPEPIEPNAFEEFAASVAKPETVPDLDTIMTMANEQTLDETLIQLSLYLTEASPYTESPPLIQKTLRDLAELLPHSSSNNVAEEVKVTITPELTQQLLTLLRAVGYDNPQEVLITFVKENSFEFLVAAIRRLSQLCDDDRQELLHIRSARTTSKSGEPLTIHLGKAILSLMTRFKVPEVAISS